MRPSQDMMSNAEHVFHSVHAEGLTPTERTIFAGMIRLAERHGRYFRIEAASENADIYILDGTNQRSVQFGSSPDIAQHAIWIDPPAHLQATRHLARPLRWSVLLQLMEQIVGGDGTPTASVAEQPFAGTTLDRLIEICQSALRQHIGIAAEFVVDDVRVDIEARGGAGKPIATEEFLRAVRHQLPGNVDAARVMQEIAAAIAQGKGE